jgi:thioredoxin-like negative regulator of GroEL
MPSVDFCSHKSSPVLVLLSLTTFLTPFLSVQTYNGKLKVVKVDVEANPKTTEKYRVYGLPTVLIFESGKVLTHQEGAITKAKLDKLLKEKLPALA